MESIFLTKKLEWVPFSGKRACLNNTRAFNQNRYIKRGGGDVLKSPNCALSQCFSTAGTPAYQQRDLKATSAGLKTPMISFSVLKLQLKHLFWGLGHPNTRFYQFFKC